MLNIPSAIKALFQTDGTRKNVRIHFPNGELADLTNENIVKESLRFTESLCSQDVFRFGLAEASVLEFESVGVANMYGMTIEAGIEIDTSSLSAATIATIVGSPGDGVIVEENDSDLGYGFYRVPLGVFRVESCPRNHGAMTHRKVTAYTEGITDYELMSPFEVWKQAAWWPMESLAYKSIEALMDANFGWSDPTILTADYTKTALSQSTVTIPGSTTKTLQVTGGTLTVKGATAGSNRIYQTMFTVSSTYVDLYAVELGDFDNSSALAWIASSLETLGFPDKYAEAVQILQSFLYVTVGTRAGKYAYDGDIPAIYFPNGSSSTLILATEAVDLELKFTPISGTAQTLTGSFTLTAGSPYTAYRLRKNSYSSDHAASFAPSGQMDSSGTTLYSYAGSYSYKELFESWLELHGQFATKGRTGTIRRVALDPSSPTAVSPGDYSEAWWDEYNVSPIGAVTVTYQAPGGGEATEQVLIGNGGSVYDMEDNEVLKCLAISSVDDIADILTGDFADNAKNVGFTPIDLDMQGWPWIEAGDALELTAEDGTIVDTYALRLEMSGIQRLETTVTSQGGEIVGEV